MTDADALREEQVEIEARIAALRAIIRRGLGDQTYRHRSMVAEVKANRARLDEIEEDLGWAEAREDNRERQPR